MQTDMHFYGVYAIARAAGLDSETAQTVAYASQFVDDALDDKEVLIGNKQAVVPTMTSHKPIDYRNAEAEDQWKIWVPFHFLPGDDPKAETFVERMVTLPDSKPAQKMLEDSLDAKNTVYWPHLIGIAAHVYADTFSHLGFVGFASQWNRVKDDTIKISNIEKKESMWKYIMGKLEEFKARCLSPWAEVVPVGHGAVATLPDRPYLEWSFSYQTHSGKSSYRQRNNIESFLVCCQKLHKYFSEFAKLNAVGQKATVNKSWKDIENPVRTLLELRGTEDERIDAWKKSIADGLFCDATELDKTIKYLNTKWAAQNAVYHERVPGQNIHEIDACRYIRAAWRHRTYVLQELLPAFDLVAF